MINKDKINTWSRFYSRSVSYLFGKKIINYGISDIVRKWCNYPKWLPFRFEIHHGWYTAIEPRDTDLRSNSPIMMVYNKRQKDMWEKRSKKPVFIVAAPFIHFRRMEKIEQNKNACGTIVFPSHSGTKVVPVFNTKKFCNDLKKLPKEFQPITICLHDDDLRRGFDKIYIENGFKVVCAGHRHSAQFAEKFYNILKKHKYSTSNALGSYVLYSVEMGIPFYLYGDNVSYLGPNGTEKKESIRPHAVALFDVELDNVKITDEQKEFVINESGTAHHIDPKKLKVILIKAFVFRSMPATIFRFISLPVKLIEYLWSREKKAGIFKKNLKKLYKIFLFRIVRFKRLFKKEKNVSKPSKYAVSLRQTFFGYYDKNPFCTNNSKLLAAVGPRDNRPPRKKDVLKIGYFDLKNKNFNFVGETTTWCWQQGCRLQWFPGDESRYIIYNKLVNNSYGSVVQDVYTKDKINIFNSPVYDVDKKGKSALSLNFSRLHRLRSGYGYVNLKDSTAGMLSPDSEGVWLIDLTSGHKDLLISLEQLSKFNRVQSMNGAEHYINHLSFNPVGDRFMFLHLWVKQGQRYNRLITADLSGEKLSLLEGKQSVSHYTWKNDCEILVHTAGNQFGLVEYRLYQDQTAVCTIIGKNTLNKPGHPTYLTGKRYLLLDTYPDKYSEQILMLYDLDNDELIELGSYLSPLNYRGELRCDLHPRSDQTGKFICFDSAHEGMRALYVLNI